MSLKELEEEKKKLKENQQRNVSLFLIWGQTMQTKSGLMSVLMFNRESKDKNKSAFQDDIALVVCMVTILAFTCFVVIFKVGQNLAKEKLLLDSFHIRFLSWMKSQT